MSHSTFQNPRSLKAIKDGREDSSPSSGEDRDHVCVLVLDQCRQQCPYQADIPSVSPPNDSHHGPPAGRVRLPRTHAHRLERRTDPIHLSTLLPSYHGPSGYREAFCLALRTRQYSKSATVLCPHRYEDAWVVMSVYDEPLLLFIYCVFLKILCDCGMDL